MSLFKIQMIHSFIIISLMNWLVTETIHFYIIFFIYAYRYYQSNHIILKLFEAYWIRLIYVNRCNFSMRWSRPYAYLQNYIFQFANSIFNTRWINSFSSEESIWISYINLWCITLLNYFFYWRIIITLRKFL